MNSHKAESMRFHHADRRAHHATKRARHSYRMTAHKVPGFRSNWVQRQWHAWWYHYHDRRFRVLS